MLGSLLKMYRKAIRLMMKSLQMQSRALLLVLERLLMRFLNLLLPCALVGTLTHTLLVLILTWWDTNDGMSRYNNFFLFESHNAIYSFVEQTLHFDILWIACWCQARRYGFWARIRRTIDVLWGAYYEGAQCKVCTKYITRGLSWTKFSHNNCLYLLLQYHM